MIRIAIAHRLLAVLAAGVLATEVSAQTPWDLFDDAQSTSTCNVINAADTELVVLRDGGELVIVTGRDVILADSFVDANGDVFIGEDQFGFIAFETDGDGFRTLWWTSLTGRVLDIDGLTLEIFETDTFPGDYENVPCDVCDPRLWDILEDCEDAAAPPTTIRICGQDVVVAMIFSFGGLLVLGPVRRRGV